MRTRPYRIVHHRYGSATCRVSIGGVEEFNTYLGVLLWCWLKGRSYDSYAVYMQDDK